MRPIWADDETGPCDMAVNAWKCIGDRCRWFSGYAQCDREERDEYIEDHPPCIHLECDEDCDNCDATEMS